VIYLSSSSTTLVMPLQLPSGSLPLHDLVSDPADRRDVAIGAVWILSLGGGGARKFAVHLPIKLHRTFKLTLLISNK
jgi:hypothetical protein